MGNTAVAPGLPSFLISLKTSSTPFQQKAYKQYSEPHKKTRPPVKRKQPSISGVATSATSGHVVPTHVLRASAKKLGFLCHQLGRGNEEERV